MNSPETTKSLKISGPAGESLFHKPFSWCISGQEIERIQSKIDSQLDRIWELKDDRLLVLVGALIIENAVDDLLSSWMPNYNTLTQNRDFSFSLRIEIARSMRLIPSRILGCADMVRKIRNEFVHSLDLDEFARLETPMRNSLRGSVKDFKLGSDNGITDAEIFQNVVTFTSIALYAYAEQVRRMNEYVRSSAAQRHFQTYNGEARG